MKQGNVKGKGQEQPKERNATPILSNRKEKCVVVIQVFEENQFRRRINPVDKKWATSNHLPHRLPHLR
jgi:hypothetical protein